MLLLEQLLLFFELDDLLVSILMILLELLLVDNSRLLSQLLVCSQQLLTVLLKSSLSTLVNGQLGSQLFKLLVFNLVLLLCKLKFFTSMRKDDDVSGDLVSESVELFVSLFDLLVKGLIFNLELFEIDQMETISQLFSLLEDLLLVGQSISQSDVLKSVLMHLLILKRLTFIPLLQDLLRNLLTSSRVHSILCHTSLKLLELLLNLVTFGLFLIKFGLEFRGHLVVSILGFLQVDSDLMDICKGVQILMLVHLDLGVFVVLLEVGVHHNDLLL